MAVTLGFAPLFQPPVAVDVLDALVRFEARTVPAYRTDVSRDAGDLPKGFVRAVGPLAGPFRYRPKTFQELTPGERETLLRSSDFPTFVAGSVAIDASASKPTPLVTLPIGPAELLDLEPVVVPRR